MMKSNNDLNKYIRVKTIIDEDFVQYKKPSMFIGMCYCNWKCCIESNVDSSMCQNSNIAKQKDIYISYNELFNRYIKNEISKSIVIGGLEPFLQFIELYNLIKYFRDNDCNDNFIIYTGYYKDEIQNEIIELSKFKNIIIKFGRFIPNQHQHYDNILGVNLASDNQYSEVIS